MIAEIEGTGRKGVRTILNDGIGGNVSKSFLPTGLDGLVGSLGDGFGVAANGVGTRAVTAVEPTDGCCFVSTSAYSTPDVRERGREYLTKKQNLLRVTMDQTGSRRVVLLVKGVKSELGVVGQESGLHRDELAAQGILERVGPIDHAQDVRGQADGHGSLLDTLNDVFNEGLTSGNALVVLTLWECIRQDFIQELEKTSRTLNILGNLR